MVPPSWNGPATTQTYVDAIEGGATPTAVTVSVLDVSAPAVDQGPDWYWHWGWTHFVLDGHHKLEAAARLGKPLRVLSLFAVEDGLATPDQVDLAIDVRGTGRSAPR